MFPFPFFETIKHDARKMISKLEKKKEKRKRKKCASLSKL